MIGGAERVFRYLAEALAAEGAEIMVVTSRMQGLNRTDEPEHTAGPTAGGKPGEGAAEKGSAIVRLGTSPVRFWGTWRYMRNLRRWFAKNPIDLAYVSMLKHDAYVTIGAGQRWAFPVVLRPEGAGATGDVSWQSWGNFGRQIGLRCRRADAFVAISKPIEKELLDAWHAGTMRPAPLAEVLRPTLGTPRIVPIPNGVPVPKTAWQPRADWQAAPKAVFVGRLAPEKGLDTLIEAWPAVRASYPAARLIVYGEGPQRAALEDQVRRLRQTFGPGRAVELAGITTEPTRALRDADLFVLPSREEGMSIALLEAMALGIPLVASSIPGNRRLVTDLVHGRLVPSEDHARLAQAIIEQWQDFGRATAMSRAARERVESELSVQAVARAHLALFQDIVAKRGLSRGGER
jgi:glycosyltransferase involved in cell wall biosynthesis